MVVTLPMDVFSFIATYNASIGLLCHDFEPLPAVRCVTAISLTVGGCVTAITLPVDSCVKAIVLQAECGVTAVTLPVDGCVGAKRVTSEWLRRGDNANNGWLCHGYNAIRGRLYQPMVVCRLQYNAASG